MSFSFTLVTDPNAQQTTAVDPSDLVGEDISLAGGDFSETGSGDLAVVTKLAAARQSIFRELPATPGSFPRRPAWGGGLNAMLFKNNDPTNRSAAVSRCRARLAANPRLTKISNVSADTQPDGQFHMNISVTAAGGQSLDDTIVFTPTGGS